MASDQYVSALKSVAILGSLFMIIGYEGELAKSQPQNESTQVRVNPSLPNMMNLLFIDCTRQAYRPPDCVLNLVCAGRSRCG
eukprot:COSAG02_NODE_919_length_15936_cov_5.055314_28_plen_82_part_00